MPKRPSPASESEVLRVDGAAATPSRSPKGNEMGHGMGKVRGSVGLHKRQGEHAWGKCGEVYRVGGDGVEEEV